MDEIKKVGIFINTPAQYHFYKNIALELGKLGVASVILYRDYGETKSLVQENKQHYFEYSHNTPSLLMKSMMIPVDVLRACRYLKDQGVDLVTGFGVYDCFSASLLGIPCIVFNDSEPYINSTYSIQYRVFMPFTNILVTPSFFDMDLGPKQIKVNSVKETAYLHPKYFSPDKSIFKLLDLNEGERYAIFRFNSFDAGHDIGISGFNPEQKRELVQRIGSRMRVFISSEAKVDPSLSAYMIKIPKSRIHDALSFASLVVTDTQTIATEAAILGTPVIRSNAFVGPKDMGIFKELERRHLLFNFQDSRQAIEKADEMSKNIGEYKAQWMRESERFLQESGCITDFMVEVITRYPEYNTRPRK
ncbi:MAG TPA: hypothetical protein VMB46_00300 [Methanomassiliicoccales archaeon]|nr:hypothetical protein [Methanomassiliicoccales archaeon]